jgi:glycosyltransferase involved in cell wall biosynthesis
LIEAYRQVPANLRLPLRMRGRNSTNTKEEVQSLVKQACLEDVISVGGPIEDQDKIDFLCNAELFVMPSRWEAFSIALLETLALNVPCLASQSMPIAKSLKSSKAAVISPPQPDNLASALSRIFEGEIKLSDLMPRKFVQDNLTLEAVGKSFVAQVDELTARAAR